jgi:hypothetical protein
LLQVFILHGIFPDLLALTLARNDDLLLASTKLIAGYFFAAPLSFTNLIVMKTKKTLFPGLVVASSSIPIFEDKVDI